MAAAGGGARGGLSRAGRREVVCVAGRGRGGWWRLAECAARGLPLALFYPQVGEPIDRRVFSACSGCAVRAECLGEAMASEPDRAGRRFGVWGGLTARQRTMLAAGQQVGPFIPAGRRRRERARSVRARESA
jgi:Transcription factor WhiB